VIFCICSFVYWDSLVLKILGVTAATAGLFLLVAACFNTEGRHERGSVHPLQSYFVSFSVVLIALLAIRFVGGLISNFIASIIVIYGGVLVSLVLFRKALVQVLTTMLAIVFMFVTISNWNDVMLGHMKIRDAVRQCGQVVFQIGPIQDVANLLIAGNYMGYLSRIDYHDTQINILATRLVTESNDRDLEKTKAILDFVSKEIHYVSDPGDGVEYAKDPINTLLAGGGDCEDQTLLLCSMLETVGVKTYIAFTDEHVLALMRFSQEMSGFDGLTYLEIDGAPCYLLDPSDPDATFGVASVNAAQIRRVFDVRRKIPVHFDIHVPKPDPI